MLVLDHMDVCRDQIFNMGSDIETTTGEAIRLTQEIVGRKLKTRTLPRRSGDQISTHADIEKARRLLGYNPSTPPHVGITNYVAWYQDALLDRIDVFSSQK